MSEQNFFSQVSKSFPCLHNEDKKVMCSTLYSACTAKRSKEDASCELCPILKFAAHTFSASLVQIHVDDLIEKIKEVCDGLEEETSLSWSSGKGTPEIIQGISQTWPSINKSLNLIMNLNPQIKAYSKNTKSKKYFHLLRINKRIKELWDKNQTWQEIEDLSIIGKLQECIENLSLACAMLTLQKVLTRLRNVRTSTFSDQEGEKFDTFIQSAIQHFGIVLKELCKISSHIKETHEGAYIDEFSPTAFPISDISTIHADFDKKALNIAKDTLMWDPAPD